MIGFFRTAQASRLVLDAGVTGLYALVIGVMLSRHEMWRDECQQYLLVRASDNLPDLFDKVTRDGHPVLWYLLLYPVLKSWNSLAALAVVNFVVSVTTVLVFNRYVLKSAAEKALFASGYYVLWQYAVISRSYMLGVLLLGSAYALSRNPRYVPLALVVLGLAANVHLYYFVTAASFAAFVLWRSYREGTLSRAVLAGAGITLALLALACIQFLYAAHVTDVARTAQPGLALSILAYALLPTRVMPAFLVLPLTMVLMLAGYCCWKTSRAIGGFFLCAVCGLALLESLIYGGAPWHFGPVYVGLLLSLLLAREAGSPTKLSQNLLLLALVLQVVGSAIALRDMGDRPFSNGENAAAFMRGACPAGCTPVAALDDSAATVSAYLGGRPIYYVNREEFGTYMIWTRQRHHRHGPDQVVAAARRFDHPVMIFYDAVDEGDMRRLRIHPLAAYSGAIMDREDFYLYALDGPS